MRADKLCLAGLIATLEHYRKGDAPANIPVWQMIGMSLDAIAARAEAWAARVGGDVIAGQSAIGGGSLPGETLPTGLLALEPSDPDRFRVAAARADTPVIARIAEERVLLDPRTVLPGQDEALIETLLAAQGEK